MDVSNSVFLQDSSLVRVCPSNLEAEKGILASFLLDNNLIDQYAAVLAANDFFSFKNKVLFEAIVKIYEENGSVDTIVLYDSIVKSVVLEEVGGKEYIFSLQDNLLSLGLVERYVDLVKEKSILREIIASATHIISKCYEQNENGVFDVVDKAEKFLFEIANKSSRGGYIDIESCLKKTVEELVALKNDTSGVTGVPTGYIDLDLATGGLQPGDFIVVAARPSMGKTAFALCLARNASRLGVSVGIVSLETSFNQLVMRMLSGEAEIGLSLLRTGQVTSSDWIRLTEAVATLSESKIFIDDNAMQTIYDIKTKARKLVSQNSVKMLVIDYLQLINTSRRYESRHQEVSEVSRFLKGLAKELNIPVVALSQLSRNVENRADKRPILSDLRDSGAIEQDADLIIFLYRDSVYNKDSDDVTSAEVIIGKQRNGPTGTINMRYIREYTLFEGLDGYGVGG
jgi:replicative DNA helicase